ncbi:bifunctional riboflavin kinase/FAD synthetase [Hydrogenovibrio kuenenii]|uniref:bifunctional riboflavin kinase/FAD synthetase n=1 Tax=Hydrogenovibrio kuenenii TaxID=63658 RepID=UPI000467495C|nr:bifunctional riboflavin kinase/FAD synthetase [Hydrogenovibrio kuenenii]
MQLIRGLHNLNRMCDAFEKGCVLTIGNFDGVHLGHQRILGQVATDAKTAGLPSVVMLFEPLPIEFFAPERAPVRLMNLREKLDAFGQTDVDYVLVCRFDERFAQMCANTFVEDLLVAKLNVKQLVVGDDFRFAKNREGSFQTLVEKGKEHGFVVDDMPTLLFQGDRVSSTRIRQALSAHDLDLVQALLNKPFYFKGRVIHGQRLGRQLGFRTLNLNPKRLQMPVEGVYTVYVSGLAENDWPGIANIGVRPTVDGLRPSIEVHLFNWTKDVYGSHVGVKLHQFIRSEMKFDSLDTLKAQIEQDVQQAKNILHID